MFIAFEGPDNTGKSTSAANLASDEVALYNATKNMHIEQQTEMSMLHDATSVVTYDRIDWFSHMVYRLALPDYEWNDDRSRTVFAMPDTHLVIKLHDPLMANSIDDELYVRGKVAKANEMYFHFADWLCRVNERQGYSLFKTVSFIEVKHDQSAGEFSQRLMRYSSPVADGLPRVTNDQELLGLLRYEDHNRL